MNFDDIMEWIESLVFNDATFNNISVVLLWPVLLVGEVQTISYEKIKRYTAYHITCYWRLGLGNIPFHGGNRSTWRKPPTCRKSLINIIAQCCIECTSPWAGFELTTLVVIGTGCTCRCKSNYNTIKTTTAPYITSIAACSIGLTVIVALNTINQTNARDECWDLQNWVYCF
jgi:hypothetical protein